MRILMLGINHRTAPVELRERLALSEEELAGVYARLKERFPEAEVVVLSTCNRVEFYLARPVDAEPTAEQMRDFLAEYGGVSLEAVTGTTIRREQQPAVEHLFRVSAGLDSMVLGEPQVLGQVKRAYEQAVELEAVGPVLHRLFQDAVGAAKQVRTLTGIGEGRVSVGSVAVDFARQVFEDFDDKTVVGIGAGEMAKSTLRHLMGLGPRRLWLSSRTLERSRGLAKQLGLEAERGGARPWEDLDALLVEADVLIASTASREPILTVDRFKRILKQRKRRPLFMIDIAVPRDIEPAVGGLTNVYLYNIDDLNTVVDANVEQRREQVVRCEAHLKEAAAGSLWQVQHRDIGQLVRQLRHRLHDLGEQEQERTRRKLSNVADAETTEAVDELMAEHTHRLINKILHLPLSQLDPKNREAPLGFYAAALKRLFDLEEHGREGAEHSPEPGQQTRPSQGAEEKSARSV